MITGAGGSIGSELARQVYSLGPRRLVLVDRAESALYLDPARARVRAAAARQGGRVTRAPRQRREPRRRWTGSIAEPSPDVIFHAAAYKHVPMMEEHPSDAVHVNIGGTLLVLDAADRGRRRAVRPRLDRQGRRAVERHGRQQARRRDARRRCRAAERAGLRLGPVRQRPRLDRQRRADLPGAARERRAADDHAPGDDPLLHDHPGGVVADPRCGRARPQRRPVRARHGRAGPDHGPGPRPRPPGRAATRGSVPIEIIGLRPGEKLHEELFYDAEQVEPTEVAKVLRAVGDGLPDDIRAARADCSRRATGDRDDRAADRAVRARRVALGGARRRPPARPSWPTSRCRAMSRSWNRR